MMKPLPTETLIEIWGKKMLFDALMLTAPETVSVIRSGDGKNIFVLWTHEKIYRLDLKAEPLATVVIEEENAMGGEA